MSESKDTEEYHSEEASSQAESFEAHKSGTPETYDMKDFCPGIRIEAKDFDGKWYPAKVSDVDWTENEILVHFENWNTKFDEWIPMDSSRLRPIQKPVAQQKDAVKFVKGEEVMAVWSANQKYPGVIQAVLANDRYDVLFSDGFLKRLKSHKISKVQGGSVKNEVNNFADIGTKEERRERKRKINVAELFHKNKRPRKKGLVHSKSQDIKTYPVSKAKNKNSTLKKSEESGIDATPTEKHDSKIVNDKVSTHGTSLSSKALIDSIPAAFEVKYLNGQTEMWSKQLYQRSEGRTAGKLDIVILNPQGRKFRSRNEIMKYCEENGIIYSHEAFDFSAKGRPKSKPILQTSLTKGESNVDDKEKLAFKKVGKKMQNEGSAGLGFVPPQTLEMSSENIASNKVFIGEYEVVIENGKFICPVKICGKHFRRENLLHMHMKHYHPEFSKYLDYTPSVTDLAYARTVGNLDVGEVSSPTLRKLVTTEKPEKSVKVENVRKTDVSIETTKESKKSKMNEGKADNRNHAKVPFEVSTSSAAAPQESGDENSQKNKLNSNSLQMRRSSLNLNDNEAVVQEIKGSSLNGDLAESPTPVSENLVLSPNIVKSAKYHRLHNRKKPSRFQSSFADHIRKKRFLSQDRSKAQNKIGRHQQLQQQKQQFQQAQPSQATTSHSSIDETNSNSGQAYTVARYPKPHLNISNEISGKNNLLTICKTLSPVPEKTQQSIDDSEKTKNFTQSDLTVAGVIEVFKTKKNLKFCKEVERQKINKSVYNRRNFLANLIKASKRRKKPKRKRFQKKKKEDMGNSSTTLLKNGKIESGHCEFKGKPDEINRDSSCHSINVEGKIPADGKLNITNSLEKDKFISSEDQNDISGKSSIKLKLNSLNLGNAHDSSFRDNGNSESCSSTEPKHSFSSDRGMLTVIKISESDDEKTKCINKSFLKDSSQGFAQNKETCKSNFYENYLPIESVSQKVLCLKNMDDFHKENDENVKHSNKKTSTKFCEKKYKKRNKSKKFNLGRARRPMPNKKVRFESTIMENWISVDEEEDCLSSEINGSGKDEKKRKEFFHYLIEKDANLKLDDNSKVEISYNKVSSLEQTEGTEDSKSPLTVESEKVEKLRRNEIINCLCGITEEDGLMIQCDLCLCWQHGHCAGILKELDVPDKYTCAICKNPYRARSSMKYLHDQEWLKEGALPSLSFRSKRDDLINQRRTILKRSHDLSGSITLLAQVIHSLRIKVNIAEKKDHPKLWLWAKKWTEKKPNRLKEENEIKEERSEDHQSLNLNNEVKTEETLNQDEKQLPKAPEPEAPIDSAECRLNLLDHLIHYQTLVDARLSCIESLVAELESMQDDAVNDETPDRYPRTKATVQMILRDLNTMKKIASI